MQKKRTMKPVNRAAAAYGDMNTGEVHYSGIRRIDHMDELLRGLEESGKLYERHKRNQRRAETLWTVSYVTMAIASIVGTIFLMMMTANRLYDLGKFSLYVNDVVVMAFGLTMTFLAVISAAEMIAARVLERG